MSLFKTEAIVIKRIKFGEADRIITFFTRDMGKIQAVAKGVRRTKSKFGASLEPLTFSQTLFFGKENANLYKINNVDIIDSFQANKNDYNRLMKCMFMADTVNSVLQEKDSHPILFDLFINSLKAISEIKRDDKLSTRVNIFLLNVLLETGYAPNLSECVYCKKISKGILGFSIEKGGVVCCECVSNCEYSLRISPGALNFMRRILKAGNSFPLDRFILNSNLNMEIHRILVRYIKRHIGVTMRSMKFIT